LYSTGGTNRTKLATVTALVKDEKVGKIKNAENVKSDINKKTTDLTSQWANTYADEVLYRLLKNPMMVRGMNEIVMRMEPSIAVPM